MQTRYTAYNRTPLPELVNALLHLALIAPAGTVKSELAIAACFLAGRGQADHRDQALRGQLAGMRRRLVDLIVAGHGEDVMAAVRHVDMAINELTLRATGPVTDPGPQPAPRPQAESA